MGTSVMKKTGIMLAMLFLAATCGCWPWNIKRKPVQPVTLKDYPELCAALERNDLAQAVEGKVLVVAVWTRSCPYCVKEMIPHLKALHGNYHALGLEIVGVNADDECDRMLLENFIFENRINYPNIFDDGGIAKELKIDGYPTICIFDEKGVLVEDDFDPTDKKGLDELIAELLITEHEW